MKENSTYHTNCKQDRQSNSRKHLPLTMDIYYDVFNKAKHLQVIEEWEAEGEIYSYLSHSRPQFLRDNNKMTESNTIMYLIRYAALYLGAAWLENIFENNAKLGIYIAEKNFREKGIGEKTVKFLMKVGFNELGLHRIHLNVRKKNERALNLYKKCGFVIVKENEQKFMPDGSFQGSFQMEISRGSSLGM